ncbi:hypothetical protein MATL_G00153880 [Megalops atlanticus]|uniref:Myosin motor domain-containing protein n=1 Tax=Megalops atlanticus TaxID=7932 RepID=A0A9D3PX46_MEGAT|nr:hypothetical protein MATL_G00153880 [Megalops atlanticus]
MSHYHFIKCCCFQLCNVFRSRDMEIDQCLLDSLPLGQRQRLVRRMRCDQIRAYYERERALQRQAGPRARPGHRKRHRVRFSPADVLRDAIARHDDGEVLKLLREGADPNTLVSSGGSLLHLCARHDNAFASELLIERGLKVDQQDEDLCTALHVACACDHPDVALLLLLAGANVLLQDIYGNIPIDYAMEGTETNLILLKHMEENGVDLTCMHHVKIQRSMSMLSDVRHLVEAGGSVNQCNDEGVTLLHIACASGYKEVISLLLENGADLHVADNNLWTPLHLAAKYGQTSVVGQLLKRQANPTLLNCNGDKPSDVAASDCIGRLLLKAEECWEQSLRDPSAQALTLDELYEEIINDVATPVKKLTRRAIPISKWDSLLEKDAMFRDSVGVLAQQPSQDNGIDGSFGTSTSKVEQVRLMPPAPSDDLASLSELTNSSLLYEMQKRFGNDQIYTYIGHILLLVNPNKELPIYSTLVSQLYLSSSGRLCSSLPPHIFSSAERAYHMMLQERRPQCFILSGESGSGKTEACKHIVKHLTARSSHKGFTLEPKMKQVNCILEAFGHAKTEMNNNSSRFMKFLSLQYCEKKKTLIRARVYTYLLEKSRLTSSQQNQYNFSIFYLMAEGMSPEEKTAMNLNNMLAHRYLSRSSPVGMATGSTQSRDKLVALKQALRALGFNNLEVENLFVILSAILNLGDLRFTSLSDGETARLSDLQLLEQVSGMLQVSPEDLGSALTSDVQYFKGDVITRRHTVEMCNLYRDLLAKSLYGRVFSYLVNNINYYLQGQEEGSGDSMLEIGILDIFGFEDLQKNCFEQLCINMTSERIHQFVTEVLFQQEQTECLQDGVTMETLHSPGNQSAVLDFFFQKPQGLLLALDEESQALRPAEQNLYKKLQTQLDATNANSISLTTKDGNGNPPPQDQGPSFTVMHYAGKMTYDLTGSLERNRDVLPQNILFVMKSSENVVIRQVFQSKLTQTGSLVPPHHLKLRGPKASLLLPKMTLPASGQEPKKCLELSKRKGAASLPQRTERCGPATVAVQLRNSLCEITSKLQLCTPHFVQCVRPNSSGRPDSFDSARVSAQLQYVGVLEMVRMIRYGYPVRLPFACFLARYRELAEITLAGHRKLSPEEKCRHILQKCQLQGWQMGHSKVFLRYWQADHLSDRCHQLHRKIVISQKVVRGWLVRRRRQRRANDQQQKLNSVQSFLQGLEDLGLQAYDSLVIQNASDIARENDRKRNQLNSMHLTERPEPLGKEDEPPKRVPDKGGKANDGGGSGGGGWTLKQFRSSSVPIPLAVENLVHSAAGPPTRPATREPMVPSDEGGGSGLPSPRKQPPPKPKRDPNTRLSASYEAVSACLAVGLKETPVDALSKPRPHSDDYSTMRKVPPPKPIRSPNTKLTGSYEEIPAQRPTEIKLSCLSKGVHCLGAIPRAASADGPHPTTLSLYRPPEDDDVYIEMVGHPRAVCPPGTDGPELGEAVYEEMKYFPPEEGTVTTKTQPANPEGASRPQSLESRKLLVIENLYSAVAREQPHGDIPAPFPNLLPHRPPLLVFPPSPVPCSPASDESPLTPLEVKKLPVLETNLNYPGQGKGGSPLSPQYARQRADSSPSLFVFMPDKSTAPYPASRHTPSAPPPPAQPPPPYRPPSHFPFPPEAAHLTRAASVATSDPSKASHKGGHSFGEPPPSTGKPPYSPAKTGRPEPRRAHSCSSSPLLFNPASSRPLTSPLDELTTLFSSGRSLLRKSHAGRKIREPAGFNSNINLPSREDPGTTSPSQLQDRNANNHAGPHPHAHSLSSAPAENGNQLSNGSLEDEGHSKPNSSTLSSLHKHMDSHHSQRGHLNFSPFGAGAAL